jgi:hypothetical protein
MPNTILRPLALVALALLLSSCASSKRLAYCPGMTSVLDAVVVTQFKPGTTPDPSNALYTVKIANVDGTCSYDKQGRSSSSDISVTFQATRAAAGDDAQYTVPYFVAVSTGDRVITKQARAVQIEFPAGETTVSVDESVKSVDLRTDHEKKPYDYQILVGLQLTKAQLDYNRTVGIFAQ